MWVSFKCKLCGGEMVDFIDKEEVEGLKKSYEQDEHGQYLIVCEECN